MCIPTITPVTIKERLCSLPHLLLIAVLLPLSLTPLLFWPPFLRTWLYSSLTMSKLFALGGHPDPGKRRFGLVIWDCTHPHGVLIASAFIPIGVPLILWFWLSLDPLWSQGLDERVRIAQLLAATLVGGVAMGVFLSFHLQRMLRPRVHAGYLISDPTSLRPDID